LPRFDQAATSSGGKIIEPTKFCERQDALRQAPHDSGISDR
jgi:hypothetical protein